jgi:hypothetical protein
VIHVGLFKTGTTTIQGALGESLYDHLVNDKYYFLGRQTLGAKKMTPEFVKLKKERDVVRTCVRVHDERGGCCRKVYNQVLPPD